MIERLAMERHYRRLIWIFASIVVGCFWGLPIQAQEACGLQTATFDIIFKYGFEQPAAGLGPSLSTVSPPTLGLAPSITISSPIDGSTLPSDGIQVVGTVSGPADTGVSVNGVPAQIVGGQFATPFFALQDGSNAITAIATTIDGLTATSMITITGNGSGAVVALFTDAETGYAPSAVGFTASIPTNITVQNITLAFGDGTSYSGVGSIPRHTYAAAGIYQAHLTITDTSSQHYTASRTITVVDLVAQRQTLCAVYAHLRARMAASDVTGALYAFQIKHQQKYRTLFNALGTNLSIAATRLGVIGNGTIGLTNAELYIILEQTGQVNAYPIHMAMDGSGVWRIDAM
jgi:PKD repeat protein